MDYKLLGSKIRNERLRMELTQAQLSEKVDVTTAYIGQIERGIRKFSIETLVDIATVLNVSVDFLLRDNMPDNSNVQISGLLKLLEKRHPDDISLAMDVVKSLFEHIDKRK